MCPFFSQDRLVSRLNIEFVRERTVEIAHASGSTRHCSFSDRHIGGFEKLAGVVESIAVHEFSYIYPDSFGENTRYMMRAVSAFCRNIFQCDFFGEMCGYI